MENNENGLNRDNNGEVSFVQEKIKPKTKKRLKKALSVTGMAVLAGLVFGLIARVSFDMIGAPVARVLGLEAEEEKDPPAPTGTGRSEVTFPTVAPSPTPTPAPPDKTTPTPSPDVTESDPDVGDDPGTTGEEGTPASDPTGTVTPDVSAVPEPVPGQDGEPGQDDMFLQPVSPLDSYFAIIEQIRSVAKEAQESLVRIYSVTRGINWMDDNIETRRELTGVLMGENGVELLVLTDYGIIMNADRIDVEICDNIYEGILYNYDADTNIAVIGVPLELIDEKTMEKVCYMQLGDSTQLYGGEPVIAMGRPNGYYGAFEIGFVSHTGLISYIIDGELGEFTTDHFLTAGGDGIITDLQGRLVGLIPYTEEGDVLNHIIGIDCLKSLILKLLNGAGVPYFGIRSENIPKEILDEMGVDNGIYVNEAVSGSPAALAGIKKGDVIVSVNDVKISGVSQFYEYLLTMEEDASLKVKVFRSSRVDEPFSEETVVLVKK